MPTSVIVANSNPVETRALIAALAPHYQAKVVADAAQAGAAAGGAAALILDLNMVEGDDMAAWMADTRRMPVLVVVAVEDQMRALGAIRHGAACYLVKGEGYESFVSPALEAVIERDRASSTVKVEAARLQQRVNELEAAAGRTPGQPPAAGRTVPPKRSLNEELAARLRSGDLALPAYPQIAMKVRELLDTDVGINEIGRLLSQDAAVSAKLLQVANSAQYANVRKVDTVENAVSRIGLAGACNLAEMLAKRSLYSSRSPAYMPFLDELWVHSMACAHACTILGRLVERAPTPKLFSLGLLHDVGKLAMLHAIAQSDVGGKLIEGEEGVALFRTFLRTHHAQFGVALMRRWRFDEEFLVVAGHHDDLGSAKASSRPLLIVHLANLLARSRGYGEPLTSPEELHAAPSKAQLFPGDADLDALGEELDRAVEMTRDLLG